MKNKKIFVAGGFFGIVGRSIVTALKNNYKNIIVKPRNELDLTKYNEVNEFFNYVKPEIVINAAAKVGGIIANSQSPYEFLFQNLQIQNNLMNLSFKNDIEKFIFLGLVYISKIFGTTNKRGVFAIRIFRKNK